jgi:catechol 2,3-dioxygenase
VHWRGGRIDGTPHDKLLERRSTMAFKVKRVGHLVLRVKDIERSKRFFQDVLNFPVVGQNDRGMVFFSTDKHDNHHQLALVPAKEGVAMPNQDSVGMHHVSFELGTFAELQEAYRVFKEKDVRIHHTVFHGVSKSVYFEDPDGNMLEVYVNVPEEQYSKSVPNPYSRYGSIDDELTGKTEQKVGTVVP